MTITVRVRASGGSEQTITLADPVVTGTPPPVETFTVGETAVLSTTDSGNGNLLLAQKHTLPRQGQVVSLSFNVINPAGQLYLAVYDAAGALKARTDVFTPVAGWNTKPVVMSDPIAPGDIWLSYHPSSSALSFRETGNGSAKYVSRAFGVPPATFPTNVSTGSAHWSFYATLTTSDVILPPPPPPSAPTVTSIAPNPAPAGLVTVNGTNFVAPATVSFGGVAATGVSVTSSTQLSCTAPAHADGAVNVTVTTAAGTSNAVSFTYRAATPPPPGLPPLWNANPPAGVSPAPSGPDSGNPGDFDSATLAQNEVWDNFDGAAGTTIDSRLWLPGGFSEEPGVADYDESTAHVFKDGNSHVILRATNTSGIQSGKFSSRTKFNVLYGWIAARIKFAKSSDGVGRSWFPAFWLLHVPWNGGVYAEVDIMEIFGDSKFYSSHVYPGTTSNSLIGEAPVPASQGGDCSLGLHTYWMMWEPSRIRIGVDDLQLCNWTPANVGSGQNWAGMQLPHRIILNFQIHPSYLPAPLPSDFPADMAVDWVWYKPL